MTDLVDRARELGANDSLTPEQIEAVTYAHMDLCATSRIINDDSWDHRAIAEMGEAVTMTKADLEKAFPFLTEEV